MIPEIGIISPYRGFSDMIWELAGEIDFKLDVREYDPGNIQHLLDGWQNRGNISVIVSDSSTAAVLQQSTSIPVLPVTNQEDYRLARAALLNAAQICRCHGESFVYKSVQSILDNVHDGIIIIDEQGIIKSFNPAAEKITGVAAGDVLGNAMDDVKKTSRLCSALLGGGQLTREKLLIQEEVPLTVTRVPIELGHNTGLLISFQHVAPKASTGTGAAKKSSCKGMQARYRFSDIVGNSAMLEETIMEARKYSRTDAAVLITGESGTGKELFAQGIHNESSRRNGPFIAINCAALPENLLESELFGYEEGAFTGAKKGGKQGLFSLASGGTIFLDEIGDLSPALQARLLRVLQQKEVMPVGGQKVIPVDVRVISATNRNLLDKVEQNEFRMDLYYRLNVLHLHVPPLRKRMEDVPLLFKHFFQELAGLERMQQLQIDDKLLEELKSFLWPGNVRELQGFVERYSALGEEDIVNHTSFRHQLRKLKNQSVGKAHHDEHIVTLKLGNMEDMERQIIEQAREMVGGNKGKLARVLGVSRTTVWKKLKD